MNLKDAFELGGSIVVSLGGGGAIVFGLSSYLGKLWADRALEKEKHEYAVMLQSAKNELDQATNRYQVALDSLGLVHKLRITEEFTRLGQLGKYFAILQDALRDMLGASKIQFSSDNEYNQQRATEYTEAFNLSFKFAREFFFQEKVFIPLPAANCAAKLVYEGLTARRERYDFTISGSLEEKKLKLQSLGESSDRFADGMIELEQIMRQHIEGRDRVGN